MRQKVNQNLLNIGKKYDLIAIVRGGGSQLDFSAFDTYDLGLKIATFPIPIIAGIGHERNVSIADLMCFNSLKTLLSTFIRFFTIS